MSTGSSSSSSSSERQGFLVEVSALFVVSGNDEADELACRSVEAILEVVCPPDNGRLVTCGHCEGTGVNPSGDLSEGTYLEGWAPGLPCAVCAASGHPGQEMPCAREHVAGATVHPDGVWLSEADRRLFAFLQAVLVSVDEGDLVATRLAIVEKLAELNEVVAS